MNGWPDVDMQDEPLFLARPGGERLAYHARKGKSPALVFLSGFRSDMAGTKAVAVDDWAAAQGRACIRFDYFAHGRSSGDFMAGTIGRWLDDTLAVLDAHVTQPAVLIGSSMGGWLACLAARARPGRVKALVLIAPALDFTRDLLWAQMSAPARDAIMRDGVSYEPSAYGDPYPFTRTLIEEGDRHLLLGDGVPFTGPVRILQGMKDTDVPWQHALKVSVALHSDDVRVTLFKDGDHRLSKPAEIEALIAAVGELLQRA
jgi:pimeloyl-ACP methyl ester carboxylesterase